MPSFEIVKEHHVPQSFRVSRVMGQFDIPLSDTRRFALSMDAPFDDQPWQIGVITGASGAGKTMAAKELFPSVLDIDSLEWTDAPIVDDFPKTLGMDDIVMSLTSVGLSTIPTWLSPFDMLSNGEKFRAAIARLLVDGEGLLVVDEFTSVVDRTVAKAVSVAVSKYIRRGERQFVAVTCHRDIIPWLAPDWVIDLDDKSFFRCQARRPEIRLRIYRGSLAAWPLFARYHYMTQGINRSARVYLASVTFPDGADTERLCGFFSLIPLMGKRGWWRGHRTVVLPDFQGLGIGNRMVEDVAEMLYEREGIRYAATTSSPSLNAYRRKRPDKWRLRLPPMNQRPSGRTSKIRPVTSAGRLTASWEYIPRALGKDAEGDARKDVASVGV